MAAYLHKAGEVVLLECAICGASFQHEIKSTGRRARYCSGPCKAEAQRRQAQGRRKPIRHEHQCERCGSSFSSKRPEARFCSTRCQRAGKHYSGTHSFEDKACRQCGTLFHVRKDNDRRFCSASCRVLSAKIHDAEKHGTSVKVTTRHKICRGCGARFHTRHGARVFCSDACSGAPAIKTCADCGCEVPPAKWLRRCAPCAAAHRIKARKKANASPSARAAKAYRKALHRGRVDGAERFDPLEVLERDGWRCHLCGVKTPKSLRGTYHDRAPELDHILPLAAGGKHTRANTACACRRCNLNKGATPLGQLRLTA